MKRLVIFDLDGTLLNTISDLGVAVNFALESNGFPGHPLGAYRMMVGNGVRRLVERALPSEHRNAATIDSLLTSFRKYYDAHLWDFTTPYDGVPELLAELADRQIAVAVASNKYESAVRRLVDHFFNATAFAAVCGQIEGYPPKPDPSIVFRLLNEFPMPKAEVIYVGDSAVDIETAYRACVDSIGVTWGFRPTHELANANPNFLISNPADILNCL